MLFENLIERGSVSVLQHVMTFTEKRHSVLANNVANFDTVGYKMKDLPVAEFNKALTDAIEKRDRRGAGASLDFQATRHFSVGPDKKLKVRPSEIEGNNILFHDKNNRFIEKQMTEMAKNSSRHTRVTELLRQKYDLLRTAIRGRV